MFHIQSESKVDEELTQWEFEGKVASVLNQIPYHTIPYHTMPCHAMKMYGGVEV